MAPLKVLIAEDEKVTQRVYQASLPGTLCQCKIADNGEDAIRLYDEWKPDVVLLDFSMPTLNGYQVLKTIREERRDKATVIIMVTGQSDKDSIVACAKLGVHGYIVKPFINKQLAPKIVKIYRDSKK
ncbi:MAG: response regulator [Proteobacteria bacterium]|nr:response regulator [Desulfobulbaceae bacterium]MBU4153729.1 response regulator [Pseudomonadota bacterium]